MRLVYLHVCGTGCAEFQPLRIDLKTQLAGQVRGEDVHRPGVKDRLERPFAVDRGLKDESTLGGHRHRARRRHLVILAKGNGERGRIEVLAQCALCIQDGEHLASSWLFLLKWQHDAIDRAVIAELLGSLAFHAIKQAGLAIDPESEAASAADSEAQAIPGCGSLRFRGKQGNRGATKFRQPVSTAGQVSVVNVVRTVWIGELNVSVRILMPALRRAIAIGLLYFESGDFNSGHIGAAAQVLDIVQASGLPGDLGRSIRVAHFKVLPGVSTSDLIKVLENGLSRRLVLCGVCRVAIETNQKGDDDKTHKKRAKARSVASMACQHRRRNSLCRPG